VFVSVQIVNAERLPIGTELRQEGVIDTWEAEASPEPALSVYLCPNGEGVSGNADDIFVTRTGPETFEFHATSSVPEQNLDVDVELAALQRL